MREITDLARKAASRYGLLTHHDLRELGVTARQRHTLTGKGVLVRERRGLYSLVGTVRSWEFEVMRACLGAAGRGVASCRSAMRLWVIRPWETAVEVMVRGIAAPDVEGAEVHRSYDLIDDDVRHVSGIPVTSPERTLVDAGAYLPDHQVARAFDSAVGSGLTTPAAVRALRERVGRHGRTGVTAIDRVLESVPDGVGHTESPMEIALLRLIEGAGLPTPEPQFPIELAGHRFRVDFAYPDRRVVLEYDGFEAHSGEAAFARDRWRQNQLVLAGWLVLRFTKADLGDRPEWVASKVRAALARVPR